MKNLQFLVFQVLNRKSCANFLQRCLFMKSQVSMDSHHHSPPSVTWILPWILPCSAQKNHAPIKSWFDEIGSELANAKPGRGF
jgi:hypothetical protein